MQTPLERMQWYLTGLNESCYHMLGSMGPSLGRDLYNIPDLALAFINSVLSCLQVSLPIVPNANIMQINM